MPARSNAFGELDLSELELAPPLASEETKLPGSPDNHRGRLLTIVVNLEMETIVVNGQMVMNVVMCLFWPQSVTRFLLKPEPAAVGKNCYGSL